MTKTSSKTTNAKQKLRSISKFTAVKFLIVGAFNTVLDLAIFNTLVFGFNANENKKQVILFNVISTTIVMLISFFINRNHVFKVDSDRTHRQLFLFLAVSAFSIYIVQSGLIWIYLHTVNDFAIDILDAMNISDKLSLSIAKLAATAGSMTTNFLGYKFIVFRKK